MTRARRWTVRLILLALLVVGTALLVGYARLHPEAVPWTELDLAQPIGPFTGRKLAGLADDGPRCRALLDRAGVRVTARPARQDGPNCGFADGVRLADGGALTIAYTPAGADLACPVAAGLALWEWHVVQPAAQRHLGQRVVRIEHLGAYQCRRLYGGEDGAWSEHATADALDVAAFRLADGRRISILDAWRGPDAEAAFLREVRDGACRVFATVLSPDYNAAHRDHLHLDQAARGATGWRACR